MADMDDLADVITSLGGDAFNGNQSDENRSECSDSMPVDELQAPPDSGNALEPGENVASLPVAVFVYFWGERWIRIHDECVLTFEYHAREKRRSAF